MKDIPHEQIIPDTQRYLSTLCPLGDTLDFGSGAKRYLGVKTYDPNPKAKADFQRYEDLPLNWGLVYCNQVGEHAEDLRLLTAQIASLLPPGGMLVCRCPHLWGPRGSHFRNWVRHWWKGNHENVWWRTAGTYRKALERHFRIVIDMRRERHRWLWPICHVDFLCFR